MPPIPTPDATMVFDNALFYLQRSLDAIARGDRDEVTGVAYFNASVRFRMAASAALLARADRRRFFGLLRKSGLLRLHFLRLVAAGHVARRDHRHVAGANGRPRGSRWRRLALIPIATAPTGGACPSDWRPRPWLACSATSSSARHRR
jgi:hypothetical protein